MSISEESKTTHVELLTVEKGEHATRRKVLLIFVHGAFTANDRYKQFLQSVQQASLVKDIEVDIGYGTYTNLIPNPAQTTEILSALNQLSTKKYDAKLLMGHSMGGLIAVEAAYPSSYDGLIQLGCNFQMLSEPKSLASYPKPVLTLQGEADGFLKYFALLEDMKTLDEEIKRRNDSLTLDLERPIIVLKDVNHMQAADGIVGEMTLKTNRHDFESSLSLKEAHAKMAEVIASFVAITALRPSKSLQNSDGMELQKYVQACQEQLEQTRLTREMLIPFQSLSNESFVSEFAREMQRSVANIKDEIKIVSNFHGTKHDFVYSKPILLNSFPHGDYEVHIHYVAQDPIQWHEALPESASQISPTFAIKARSQGFLSLFYTEQGEPCSIMELNQKNFEKVWNEYVTEEQQAKYKASGRKLQFGEDVFIPSPPAWVDTPLKITHSGATTIIQSPYTETGVDNIVVKFRGMFYAKPMTPAQMYEWIVYDTYRKIPSSK